METLLRGTGSPVVIGPDRPTVIIGEEINPTGKARLAQSLLADDLSRVQAMALRQVGEGADVLDVNVGAADVDEVALLPRAVQAVQEVVDVPLCIDSANPRALAAALSVYRGVCLINSLNGERKKLEAVLPLLAEHHAAVIALAMDDNGIPQTAEARYAVIARIVERAGALGIDRERIIVDCLALAVSAGTPVTVSLEAMRLVRERLGLNQTIGSSNVSFGLPRRQQVNDTFLAMCLACGVTAPIVNAGRARGVILSADVLLGRDDMGLNYVRWCRQKPPEG